MSAWHQFRRSMSCLTSPLRKLWSRGLRRRRRKLKCLIVQLKRRASVERRTYRWLYHDDSFAIGQNDRAFDVPLMVFVDVNATFRIQDLV